MSNVTRYECDENVNIIIFIQSYYIKMIMQISFIKLNEMFCIKDAWWKVLT